MDYMTQKPVGGYDEEFEVAPFNSLINNLEMIDNIILNNLANQNWAPSWLIKKRAEKKLR